VATPLAYLPQYTRLSTLRSSDGISFLSSLLLALAAQTQVVTMYYIFMVHLEWADGSVIAHPPDAQNWVDFTQILVQWVCSLFQ
jgi:hypothetical protein